MFRRLLLLAFLTTICVTGVMLLIRGQPLDATTARAILEPVADCVGPCWQGVLPGVTSAETALALLRRNPWMDGPDFFTRIDAVGWRWSGAQPPYIDTTRRSVLTVRADGTVDAVFLVTAVPLGDLFLLLGQPDVLWVFPNNEIIAVYQSRRLELKVALDCPVAPGDFWRAPVEVRWQARPHRYDVFGAYPFDPADSTWFRHARRCGEAS